MSWRKNQTYLKKERILPPLNFAVRRVKGIHLLPALLCFISWTNTSCWGIFQHFREPWKSTFLQITYFSKPMTKKGSISLPWNARFRLCPTCLRMSGFLTRPTAQFCLSYIKQRRWALGDSWINMFPFISDVFSDSPINLAMNFFFFFF